MSRPWRMIVVAAIAVVAIGVTAAGSEARSAHGGTGRWDATPVAPTAVLDWNATALATVRAAVPAKFQLESFLYMSYVQASVYDAVTKIDGRYERPRLRESCLDTRGVAARRGRRGGLHRTRLLLHAAEGNPADDV